MFLNLFDEIALVSGVLIKAISLYFVLMCLFFLKPVKPKETSGSRTSFACVIAARNEEMVIGRLVESLLDQDYPPELIKVFVIPNNCTDRTEEAAKKAGAEIIRVRGPVRTKGDALNQAFGQLMRRDDIDAFLLFDADNIVDRNYMKAMDEAFAGGAQVTKSRIEAKNPYVSWVSGCYGLYYNIFNLFFNESRARIGIAPKLIGTGLGFRRDLILEKGGWNTVTIAEDTEFNADCVLEHCRISWVPKAVTYDEAPVDLRTSLKQRRRWAGGIMEVAKEKVPDLLTELRTMKDLRQLIDMMMILIMPHFQVVSLIPTAIMLTYVIYSYGILRCLLLVAVSLAASYVGITAGGLVLSIRSPYRTAEMTRAILMFPVFTLSWIPLCLMAAVKGSGTWVQIRHTGSVSPRTVSCAGKHVRELC
ncbi:MAG: glycosyltransferase family 2 protein [Clostridia bacterium]|nr:glycosyltransferase family 2 protein [Clostridia bacterium]